MTLEYGIEIDDSAVYNNIKRITNQIFKLLPCREEGGDWETPLQNLIVEVGGLSSLLGNQEVLLQALSKMEGLLKLTDENDFFLFRKNVFECLNLIGGFNKCLD